MNEQRKVIRFSAFADDFLKDRFAARYSSPHLPVPRIEETCEAFGTFFAISPYVEGKMIDDFSAAEMPPSGGESISLRSIINVNTV